MRGAGKSPYRASVRLINSRGIVVRCWSNGRVLNLFADDAQRSIDVYLRQEASLLLGQRHTFMQNPKCSPTEILDIGQKQRNKLCI